MLETLLLPAGYGQIKGVGRNRQVVVHTAVIDLVPMNRRRL